MHRLQDALELTLVARGLLVTADGLHETGRAADEYLALGAELRRWDERG